MTSVSAVKKNATSRYTSLDGLRGAAALTVLLFHTSLLMLFFLPALATDLIYKTPIGILFAGKEAVSLFFVLSGYVLTLPVLANGFTLSWTKYYVTRLLRLSLPSIAAICFAALTVFLVPQVRFSQPLAWFNERVFPGFSLQDIWQQVVSFVLITPQIDDPLWSIKWEIYFSLLLPFFMLLVRTLRRYPIVLILGVLVMLAWGSVSGNKEDFLYVYATFMTGVLLAVYSGQMDKRVRVFVMNKPKRSSILWVAVLILGCGFIVLNHFTYNEPASVMSMLANFFVVIGAALILITALRGKFFVDFLNKRVMQFLGKISFSLYLVHVPIILLVAHVIGLNNWLIVSVVAILASLILATIFQRFIEAPSHRFAKWAGIAFPAKLRAMYVDIRTNGITVRKPPAVS